MVKVILSRKGFDSAAGGGPSPVVDGRLVSLPIPEPSRNFGAGVPYSDIRATDDLSCAAVMVDLGYGVRPSDEGHLDPDLEVASVERPVGWRPCFGQAAEAQAHLANQGVAAGDLFLFFGQFRHAERTHDGRLRWRRGATPFHAIFGYMSIGEVHPVGPTTFASLPWAVGHPHLRDPHRPANTLYVAAEEVVIGGSAFVGAGTLRLTPEGTLTRTSSTMSHWVLPAGFAPGPDGTGRLSYHARADRWSPRPDGRWDLRSVGRGQEFVIDADEGVIAWALEVISDGTSPG